VIISHKHRYVFVQLPRTGCTAISKELLECYDGQQHLKKHSNYREFLRAATPDERKYFAFSGIRNPLDRTVSDYLKYKTNHLGEYTDPKKLDHMARGRRYSFRRWYFLRRFRHVQRNESSFDQYFLKFYRWPYDDWSSLDHHKFGYIIRFENLQEDFSAVLDRLNIKPVREVPHYNPTKGKEKKSFWEYYSTPEVRLRAQRVFGYFIDKWGYSFPDDWEQLRVGVTGRGIHACANLLRKPLWLMR